MSEKSVSKIKIPVFLKIIQVILFIFPSAYFQSYMAFTGKLDKGESGLITGDPIMLGYQVFFTIALIVICYFTWTQFSKYDGSDESSNKVNFKYRINAFAMMGLVIINGLFYPFFYSLSAQRHGVVTVEFLPLLMLSFGETLMFGMFFYLIWLSQLEKFMSFLKFEKKDIVISVTLKNVLVALFSTLALLLLTLQPLLYSFNEGIPLNKIFLHKCFPMALTGVVFIPIDFFILTNISVSRIKDLNRFAQVIAEGDYTQSDLKVITRDEFGVLANSLNKFHHATINLLKGMGTTVANSTESANSTSHSMEDISASTNQMITNIQEIQNQMNDQASSVEESTGAIGEILQNIQNLNSSIEEQSAAVEESSAAINQMVANIQSVTTILEKNEMSTNQLAEASAIGQEKVTEAVQLSNKIMEESKGLLEASTVVQNIATQTNLLAMNAAIEAAHAGDAGKGFAVVADEIRKLAEQSNVQGKRITESLQSLEDVIANVAGSTNQLSEQFSAIFELTKVVKQQEDVVMAAMKEQASGSNQILLAMRNIGDITGSVKEGSAEMLAGGTQLSKEMELLNSATTKTNTNVNEMANGANLIINAVEKGNDASSMNNESIQQLVTEMNKFKLN